MKFTKENIKRFKHMIKARYEFIFKSTLYYLINTLMIIIYLSSVYLFINHIFVSDYVLKNKDIMLSIQFSITFLVVAIISTVSSKSNEYIYGERIIDIVFEKRLIGIRGLIFTSVLVVIINTMIFLTGDRDKLFAFLFFSTIGLLCYIIMTSINLAYPSKLIKNKLKYTYYKNFKNAISLPQYDFIDSDVSNLIDYTIYTMNKGNLKEGHDNLNIVFSIFYKAIDGYLNHYEERLKLKRQYNIQNIFSTINNLIYNLFRNNFFNEAIHFYKNLLIFHNKKDIYILHRYNTQTDSIYKKINEIKTYNDYENYHYLILQVIRFEIYQTYLYSEKSDISEYNAISSKKISNIYISIFENKFLSRSEKEKIYSDLIFRDISMYKFKILDLERPGQKEINPKKIIGLFSVPIVELILAFFEKKDSNNIKLFINMRINRGHSSFIKLMVLIVIFEIGVLQSNSETFVKKLDIDWVRNWFNDNFESFYIKESELLFAIEVLNLNYYKPEESTLFYNAFYNHQGNPILIEEILEGFINIYTKLVLGTDDIVSLKILDKKVNIKDKKVKKNIQAEFKKIFGENCKIGLNDKVD